MEGNAQNYSTQSVNDGLATAALLSVNKGYSGETDGPWKGVVGGGICDLREAVAHTRADIRESIQNLSNQNTSQFAHVHEKACDAEKEAIKAQYEGKLQTLTSAQAVEKSIMDSRHDVTHRVEGFERNVDNRFCSVEKLILTEGSATRELVRDQGERTRSEAEKCCCSLKEKIAELSREHVVQQLAEAKDELAQARFALINAEGKGDK